MLLLIFGLLLNPLFSLDWKSFPPSTNVVDCRTTNFYHEFQPECAHYIKRKDPYGLFGNVFPNSDTSLEKSFNSFAHRIELFFLIDREIEKFKPNLSMMGFFQESREANDIYNSLLLIDKIKTLHYYQFKLKQLRSGQIKVRVTKKPLKYKFGYIGTNVPDLEPKDPSRPALAPTDQTSSSVQ